MPADPSPALSAALSREGVIGAARGYFDHAATTPTRPEALEAMLPYFNERFANPSGGHRLARQARRALDDAREEMAELLGAKPSEVVFTSGGTEADDLAVLGVHDRVGGTLLCSAIEHHAVLDPVLSRGGRTIAVGATGALDLDALASALGPDVTLVSLMLVNNETGVVQPLGRAVELVRELAPRAAVHTDAIQAFCWMDVASAARSADLVSVSSHKFGGPKGVGALVVRAGVELAPRQLGGGQERGLRSGTSDVAGVVGMAAAARIAAADREHESQRVGELRSRLLTGLLDAGDGVVATGAEAPDRVPGICHVCIDRVDSETLLFMIEEGGIFASAASSCSSGAAEPSHVLAAMAVDPGLAAGSLRLSLGWTSTDSDVDLALQVVPDAISRLREHAVEGSAV